MKLDILVLAAHPDDAELGCGGTIALHVEQGKKVGIVDFTKGELGTRGTSELRAQEAKASSQILGLTVRDNLTFADAFFVNDKEHQLAVIEKIRQYRPDIVLANAIHDRHSDHAKAADLATTACFLSGLQKIETRYEGKLQEAWRPKAVYHFIQNNYIKPDVVVDITQHWATKIKAIRAFKSQFYDPESGEPQTFLSTPHFMEFVDARAKELGHAIGVDYGEGFTVERTVGISNLFHLL
jgi:bacillithiol biosynthesis deacetylase BshB1